MEIQLFNSIFFWKKYFKDLLKIFIIELKEKIYYYYLYMIILYSGLCSFCLTAVVTLLCCNGNLFFGFQSTDVIPSEPLQAVQAMEIFLEKLRLEATTEADSVYIFLIEAHWNHRDPTSATALLQFLYNQRLPIGDCKIFFDVLEKPEARLKTKGVRPKAMQEMLKAGLNEDYIEYEFRFGNIIDSKADYISHFLKTDATTFIDLLENRFTMDLKEKTRYKSIFMKEELFLMTQLKYKFNADMGTILQASVSSVFVFLDLLELIESDEFIYNFRKYHLYNAETFTEIIRKSMQFSFRYRHQFNNNEEEYAKMLSLTLKVFLEELIKRAEETPKVFK
jgi:hypothetical protein